MKHQYQLIINQGHFSRNKFTYAFGRTKNIQLHIHNSKAMIEFSQDAVHSQKSIQTYGDYLCSDAIKKAMLIHLLLYAKPLIIRSLQLSVDGQISHILDDQHKTIVYSMINTNLDSPVTSELKEREIFCNLLNTTKSAYDGRHNALIALLLAKASAYRSEKAMYLWMSMNGLYGFLAHKANEHATNSKARITQEWEEQNFMCLLLGIGKASLHNVSGDDKTRIMQEAMSMVRTCDMEPESLYDGLKEGQKNTVTEKIGGILAKYNCDMEPYSFLCIWLPYQIRCKYFHSNAAIPLFSYADEPIMEVLRYTNYMVERFVEEHLPVWLTTKELTEEQDSLITDAYKRIRKKEKAQIDI